MRRSHLLLCLLMFWSVLALLSSCMSCNVGSSQLWIDATPLAGRPNLEVTFLAKASKLPGSYAYTAKSDGTEYLWDFGDSTTGTGQTVTHTYTESGYYEVWSTHTMEDGRVITAKIGIMVDSSDIAVYPLQEWEDVEQATDVLPSRLEVAFAPNTSLQEAQTLLAHLPVQVVGWIEDLGVFQILLDPGADSQGVTNALLAIPEVEQVAPEYLAEPLTGTPTAVPDYEFHEQLNPGWNKMRVELGLDLAGSDEVKIAVVDSGYDTDHPELVGQVDEGWSYGLWGDMEDDSSNKDMNGHGTTVLGVMAAREGNGWLRGIAPPNAYFIVIKINRWAFVIAAGICRAVKQGANVINVSYSSRHRFTLGIGLACQNAYDNNCLVVAGAGNTGEASLKYPARYDTVLGVGGTNPDDDRCKQPGGPSCYGSTAVYAPEPLYTTIRGGATGPYWGTSIAAPAVTGLAALIFSLDNTASVDNVRDIIKETCDGINFPGIGRVNFYRAMMEASGRGDPGKHTLPPVVNNVDAHRLCTEDVQISWEHPPGSDAVGVRIYRMNIEDKSELYEIATVAETQGKFSFIDLHATINTFYTYFVFAVDAVGQLSRSYTRDDAEGAFSGEPPPPGPPEPGGFPATPPT